MKPCILIVTDYFLPGYKGGGPIRSIANMVQNLKDDFDFRVLTTDRDLKDEAPYTGIPSDQWVDRPDCPVCYLSPRGQNLTSLAGRIREIRSEILYLNGVFSKLVVRTLLLYRAGRLGAQNVVLAPRGMLAPGSLYLKRWKKIPYLMLTKKMGFYRYIIWHASSDIEAQDIQIHFPDAVIYSGTPIPGVGKVAIIKAMDLHSSASMNNDGPLLEMVKEPGIARFVFLSRISKVKNLVGALDILSRVSGNIYFAILGPIEDGAYWRKCQKMIERMPDNVNIHYGGPVPPDQTVRLLGKYQFFLLLSHGENFGHVIVEALTAGLPVIISDRTPWRNLEREGVGWDLDLSDERLILETIDHCVRMGAKEYRRMSFNAKMLALNIHGIETARKQNIILFRETLRLSPGGR